MDLEIRDYIVEDLDVREADGLTSVSGMAVPFNRDSEDLGGFVERIAPESIVESVRDNDIVMLWQHDASDPITRVSTGLELDERKGGLHFKANAGDFTERMLDLLHRGVVKQMSFGFMTRSDEWLEKGKRLIRTILDMDLKEISPVTFPAYRSTKVAARSAYREGFVLHNDLAPMPEVEEALQRRRKVERFLRQESLHLARR